MKLTLALGRALILLTLASCTPSLNWRSVPVQQLSALLPCSPDHAKKQVDLGQMERTLSMWGCEAGGALFAVAHLHVALPATPEQVIAAWQLAAMRNIPGGTALAVPFKAPTQVGRPAGLGNKLNAKGTGPTGQPVQAELVWFSQGQDVYHLAVFAKALSPAMTEPFFTELNWQ